MQRPRRTRHAEGILQSLPPLASLPIWWIGDGLFTVLTSKLDPNRGRHLASSDRCVGSTLVGQRLPPTENSRQAWDSLSLLPITGSRRSDLTSIMEIVGPSIGGPAPSRTQPITSSSKRSRPSSSVNCASSTSSRTYLRRDFPGSPENCYRPPQVRASSGESRFEGAVRHGLNSWHLGGEQGEARRHRRQI
jgi:hypothetical protein